MNIEHLVSMANDIGNFCDGQWGPQQAPQRIAQHISRFWEARMRLAIVNHAASGGAGLSASALAAVQLLPALATKN